MVVLIHFHALARHRKGKCSSVTSRCFQALRLIAVGGSAALMKIFKTKTVVAADIKLQQTLPDAVQALRYGEGLFVPLAWLPMMRTRTASRAVQRLHADLIL